MTLRRLARNGALTAITGSCLLVAAYLLRAPILTSAARWWVVESPDLHADAIMVPGGGMDSRPFAAADLYRKHLAPRVLIPHNPESQVERSGFIPTNAELTRRLLVRGGVPNEAIEVIGTDVQSTRDEIVASLGWALKNHAKRIVVATDLFHTRRMYSFGNHLMNPEGVELQVTPIRNRHYAETNWWTREEGLIAFQNEIVKSVFYRVHHW